MRTVSASALAILSNTHGLEPVNLLKIYWTATNIRWYADKNISADIRGKILEMSEFDDVVNFDGSNATQAFNVVLDDVDGSIKEIYNYNDIHKARIQVYQWFTTIPLDDAFLIFDGEINSPIVWREGERTLAFSVVSQIEDQEVGFSPEEGLFDIIPAEMVGKPFPLPFGTCLLVPCAKLDAIPTGIMMDSLNAPDPSLGAMSNRLIQQTGRMWEDAWKHLMKAVEWLQIASVAAQALGVALNETTAWHEATKENIIAVEIQLQIWQVLTEAWGFGGIHTAQKARQKGSLRVHSGSCFPQNQETALNLKGGITATGRMVGSEFQLDTVLHPGGPEGTYETAFAGTRSIQSGGQRQIVHKLGQAWAPAGQPFKFVGDLTVRYLVCMLHCQVLNVWAFRNYNDTRFLSQVPAEYYTVSHTAFGDLSVTQIVLSKPLSWHDDSWDDELYVDVVSPVGPNTVSILTWLIENYTTKGIDSASFATVASYLSACPSNFCLMRETNVIQLLSDIAYQARCALLLKNDVFYLIFLPAEPVAVDTITEDDILVNTLELGHTPTENLVTKMVASYVITYSGGSDFKIIIRNNTLKYGVQEQATDWFTYTSPALVDLAASFWTIRKSNTWKLLRFKTPLHKIRLETFDAVTIDLESDWSHIGPVTGIVQSVKLDTKELNLQFEVWLPVRLGEMTKYNFAWPPDSTVRVDTGAEFPKVGSSATGDLDSTNGASDCKPNKNATVAKRSERTTIGRPTVSTPSGDFTAVPVAVAPEELDTEEQPEDDYEYYDYDYESGDYGTGIDNAAYPGIVLGALEEGGYAVEVFQEGLNNAGGLMQVLDITNGPELASGTWVTVLINSWTEEVGDEIKFFTAAYMIPTASTSVFMGKIIGFSEEEGLYSVELYPQGPTGDAGDTVLVTQAQIDDEELIPDDTWTMVIRTAGLDEDGEPETKYTMQVPVWL